MTSPIPYVSFLEVAGRRFAPADVIERLEPFVSERRRQRIAEVVAARTYSVVPVLEGVHDLGNVNAVMRSAEGLGYGAAHLVALAGEAAAAVGRGAGRPVSGLGTAQRQSQGADKWLDLHVWENVSDCASRLRASGYRIGATHLGADAVPIDDVDFTVPTAIVFGNEAEGVSPAMLAEADFNIVLPVDGFIQSYNISVAAALALYHARVDRIARQGRHGDLDEREQEALTASYYVRAVRHAEALLAA
jgi:tRNA (guanosine-2'-O-)-methyltransferase